MKTRALSALTPRAAALLALCAACTIDPKRPSTVDSDPNAGGTGSGGGGAVGNSGGDAGATDAGSAGDAGDGSSVGGGGFAGSGGGAPQPGPSQCRQDAMWAGPTKLAELNTADTETLLSLTPDALDVLFLRNGTLFVAHRAKADSPFNTPAAVNVPAGWSADHGAALSPDGKRLILIDDPDQKQLGQLGRASRDAAFSGAVDTSEFAAVNTAAVYSGRIYAAPVVSPGDTQLFVNASFPVGASTVVVSRRETGKAWPSPSALVGSQLDGTNTTRRLPSGVSADERTLFYFNEESSQQEARFRGANLPSSPLYDRVMLGERRGATPNAACDQLYSSTNGDLVVESD